MGSRAPGSYEEQYICLLVPSCDPTLLYWCPCLYSELQILYSALSAVDQIQVSGIIIYLTVPWTIDHMCYCPVVHLQTPLFICFRSNLIVQEEETSGEPNNQLVRKEYMELSVAVTMSVSSFKSGLAPSLTQVDDKKRHSTVHNLIVSS